MIGLFLIALHIAIDAGVLVALLKAFGGEELDFGPAFLIAFVAAIATSILVSVLASFIGVGGMIAGLVLTALLLGVAISALFGVEIKRSLLIGVVFVIVHVGISFGMGMLLSR